MHSTQSNADEPRLYHRQQLSALIDGELEADQASFLLRRLEHDDRLACYHRRWQRYGHLMRESPRCSRLRWGTTAVQPVDTVPSGLARLSRLTALLATRPGWLMRCAQVALFGLFTMSVQQSVTDQRFIRSRPPLVVASTEQGKAALITWPIHSVAPGQLSVMSITQSLNPAKAELGFGARPLPARPWPRTLLPEQNSFNADYRANQWDEQPSHRPDPSPLSALPQLTVGAKEGDSSIEN